MLMTIIDHNNVLGYILWPLFWGLSFGIFPCTEDASRWVAKVPLPAEFPLRRRTGAHGASV